MIVLMVGLPGTGKSTLSRVLAERLAGIVLDKDIIRAALFAPAHVEYSQQQDDFCQEIMLQTAAYLLGRQSSRYVFLDGRPYFRRYQRERVIEFCSHLGTGWTMVECVCREETAMARLQQAVTGQGHPAANRTPELYYQLRDAWEPIEQPRLVVDSDNSLESCAELALRYLTEAAPPTR
jgi:adenylylsulfate kinase